MLHLHRFRSHSKKGCKVLRLFLFFFYFNETLSLLRDRKWQVAQVLELHGEFKSPSLGERAASENLLKAAELRENKVVIKKT